MDLILMKGTHRMIQINMVFQTQNKKQNLDEIEK